MRTTIEIDEKLMKQAMKAAGSSSKKETVEKALRTLVQIGSQKSIQRLQGNIKWKGNVDAWRRD